MFLLHSIKTLFSYTSFDFPPEDGLDSPRPEFQSQLHGYKTVENIMVPKI